MDDEEMDDEEFQDAQLRDLPQEGTDMNGEVIEVPVTDDEDEEEDADLPPNQTKIAWPAFLTVPPKGKRYAGKMANCRLLTTSQMMSLMEDIAREQAAAETHVDQVVPYSEAVERALQTQFIMKHAEIGFPNLPQANFPSCNGVQQQVSRMKPSESMIDTKLHRYLRDDHAALPSASLVARGNSKVPRPGSPHARTAIVKAKPKASQKLAALAADPAVLALLGLASADASRKKEVAGEFRRLADVLDPPSGPD